MQRNCRFCGALVGEIPIFSIESQPSSAQSFSVNRIDVVNVIDIEIYQCEACGLFQHFLPAVPYYKDVIRAIAYSDQMKSFRINQLSEIIAKYDLLDKPILEIGSGRGEYLDLFSTLGCKKLHALEHGKKNFSALLEGGYIAHRAFPDEKFDNPWSIHFEAIFSFNFIEHWPDIKTSLLKARDLLSENGVGLFEVPNFNYMLQNKIYSEFTADHIYYFTEETFHRVLSLSGFEIVEMKSVWNNYILSAEVRRRPLADLTLMSSKKEDDKISLINYLKRRSGVTAVWGAGHQALSVLSMIDAQNYVEFIVDSAPFKQNKFCPGTGIPVYGPDYLLENIPRTLIIMAAAYSLEIVKFVQKKYPSIEEVRIFDQNGLH
jgi:SAM-dependent methyltransferase